jgi:hypothetical protein
MTAGNKMSTTLDAFGNRIDNCGVIAGDMNLDLIITSDASRNLILKNGADNIFSGIGAKAYFVFPPECNIAPTTSDQMANKAYVDSVAGGTGSVGTLSQVLTAGNDAGANSITNLLSVVGTQLPGVAALPLSIYSGTGDLILGTATNQNAITVENTSGIATFNALPLCSVSPTSDSQLVNKAYVNFLVSALARTGADCEVNGVGNTVYRNIWMDGAFWNVADFVNGGAFFMTTWGTENDPRFDIVMVGGGGSGATCSTTNLAGGAGGGGSTTVIRDFRVRKEFVQGITISIGAGGAAPDLGIVGNQGGDTVLLVPSSIDISQATTNYTAGGGGGGGNGQTPTTNLAGRANGPAGFNGGFSFTVASNASSTTVLVGGSGGGGASGSGITTSGGGAAGVNGNAEFKMNRGFYARPGGTNGTVGVSSSSSGGAGGGSGGVGQPAGTFNTSGIGGPGTIVSWLNDTTALGINIAFGVGGSAGRPVAVAAIPSAVGALSPDMGGARGAYFTDGAWVAPTNPIANTGSGGASSVSDSTFPATAGAAGRVLIRFRS